jgi:group I intron endonuclease
MKIVGLNLENRSIKMFSIYLVTNKENGKVYVGQTCQPIKRRWIGHVSHANNSKRDGYLYRSMRKNGINAFEVNELTKVDSKEQANVFEKIWIVSLQANQRDFGYNMTLGGEGTPGLQVSDESREKMSVFRKGRKHSEAHRQHLAEFLRSPEQREKIAASWRGKHLTPEHKAKIVDKLKGKPFSDEHKEKLKIKKSEQGRINIGAAQRLRREREKLEKSI